MAAAYLGVEQIIAVDIVDSRLALARELGASHALNSTGHRPEDLAEQVRALSGGSGADYAVDCTGVPAVIEQMLGCLDHGGTAASIGAPPVGSKIQLDVASFFYQNKSFVSVIEGDSNPPEVKPHWRSLS